MKKGMTLKLCPFGVDRVLNKEYFYGKSCRKCAPRASPRPLFNLGIT